MNTKQFTITPAQFTAYLGLMPSNGFTISPVDADRGQAVGRGVTINYDYDGITLTLTIVDKPFFISNSYIFGLIAEHLA